MKKGEGSSHSGSPGASRKATALRLVLGLFSLSLLRRNHVLDFLYNHALTTTRDLADLTEKGALIREGERRHVRYKLSIPLRPAPHISLNESGELIQE
jgi:hypothetical protein